MKKIILSLMLVFAVSSVHAEAEKKDMKAADKGVEFTTEAIERTVYKVSYDEKTGKATVSAHAAKKPFLEVVHPDGWKGDSAKADKAIRQALNDYRKSSMEKGDSPATLGNFFSDFGKGFVIGFTAPIKFTTGLAKQAGL